MAEAEAAWSPPELFFEELPVEVNIEFLTIPA
jgi:hypothetical protein